MIARGRNGGVAGRASFLVPAVSLASSHATNDGGDSAYLFEEYRFNTKTISERNENRSKNKDHNGENRRPIDNLSSLIEERSRSRRRISVSKGTQRVGISMPLDGSELTMNSGAEEVQSISRLASLWSAEPNEKIETISRRYSMAAIAKMAVRRASRPNVLLTSPSSCERIETGSFDRIPSGYKAEPHMGARASNQEDDDLSLNRILDDIQAGKAQFLESGPHLESAQGVGQLQSSQNEDLADDELIEVDLSGAAERYESQLQREHEAQTGFEIAWLNFTYSVGPSLWEDPRWGNLNKMFHKEHRTILKGLSGGLKSGQMVALMGPSGAGKTCLLECIAGIRVSGIGGKLCLRGRRQVKLAIVPQYDDFLPQFTVEEIITYGSKMKNARTANHKQIVNKVIEQLGLKACRSNNIRLCSGGQQKRAAIAQELVSRPNILVLDEPTSGLDSSCCYQTMKVLRDVLDESTRGEQPMAIVSTIHQPSAKVFKMFDLIYLLSKGGLFAYSGPPGRLLETIKRVTGLECPRYSNPSDYMIELVSYDYGQLPVEQLVNFEKEKGRRFVRDFEARSKRRLSIPSRQVLDHETDAGMEPAPFQALYPIPRNRRISSCLSAVLVSSKSDTNLLRDRRESTLTASGSPKRNEAEVNALLMETANFRQHVIYETNITRDLRKAASHHARHPFLWHTWLHLHRSFYQSIRDPILNNMRILIHLGFATLLVLLYGRKSGEARGCPPVLGLPTEITDPDNEVMIDLADNIGYLFMCIMMITYVSLMSMVLTFPIDIKTVGKEYKNGWYGTVTYFLGKTIADLPFIVVYPLVYSTITWYLTNQAQDQAWRFASYTLFIIMNAMNSQSFGLILGALFVNSITAATFLGPVITIPWYLFTGFTKRIHRLEEPFKSFSRFLYTRYVFEGILDTVYGHDRCNCSAYLEKYYQLRFDEAMRLGQLISVETLSSLDYYDDLNSILEVQANHDTSMADNSSNSWLAKTVSVAKNVFAASDELDLATLMESNVRSNSLFSFGLDFEPTCPSDYRNFVVQDYKLDDQTLQRGFLVSLIALSVIRLLTFMVVTWKIRTRQL